MKRMRCIHKLCIDKLVRMEGKANSPTDRSPGVSATNFRRPPPLASSLRYTVFESGRTYLQQENCGLDSVSGAQRCQCICGPLQRSHPSMMRKASASTPLLAANATEACLHAFYFSSLRSMVTRLDLCGSKPDAPCLKR